MKRIISALFAVAAMTCAGGAMAETLSTPACMQWEIGTNSEGHSIVTTSNQCSRQVTYVYVWDSGFSEQGVADGHGGGHSWGTGARPLTHNTYVNVLCLHDAQEGGVHHCAENDEIYEHDSCDVLADDGGPCCVAPDTAEDDYPDGCQAPEVASN